MRDVGLRDAGRGEELERARSACAELPTRNATATTPDATAPTAEATVTKSEATRAIREVLATTTDTSAIKRSAPRAHLKVTRAQPVCTETM
jgi:hypothetical protein